jgi:predicted cupin superfamily sugar epimerase
MKFLGLTKHFVLKDALTRFIYYFLQSKKPSTIHIVKNRKNWYIYILVYLKVKDNWDTVG